MLSGDATETRSCESDGCGVTFPVRRCAMNQRFCSSRCRYRNRDKAPKRVIANRARCAGWAREHRNVHGTNPWLLGAPPFGALLPGAGFLLSVSPRPKWQIQLRNTRGLHGLVTELLGEPHDKTMPRFALVPSLHGVGWAVYALNESRAAELAGHSVKGILFDRDSTITCGPLVRLKTPRIARRGRRLVQVDAITPVCVRNSTGGTHWTHVIPTSGNLHSTLASWLPRRVGLELPEDNVRLELVSRDTQIQETPILGKHGTVRGWVGSCVVETNAVGHWLLKCAELIGLGGKVAFGFGRIRVSDVA